MICTKWSPWWKPDVETPIAIVWISVLDLPPNCFAKDFVFSLANAVGRPLHVDLATQNGTRPSCAEVKVEVNLLATLPQMIKIIEEEDETGPEESKWIKIKYDNMPKYCKTCVTTTPEKKERKDKEVKGKGDRTRKEQSNVPVTISNKFALLEEGEAEIQRQVKKEVVEKVLKKDLEEAKKTNPNPTSTGKSSLKKNGVQSEAKKVPNPSVTGIEETNKRESTLEWVHRRFGTSKEELREMNVVVNHSCHDVPSQTYDDSKDIEENNEVRSGGALWSDEVEIMENEASINLSNRNKEERGNKQEKHIAAASPISRVNPSTSLTRVEAGEEARQCTTNPTPRVEQGTHLEAKFTSGSVGDASAKKITNETVNPKDSVQFLGFPLNLMSFMMS
uniref:DUF4283 domain-containing protein n=1 Tax=Nicotiana tabacum TaxID=4097 RepID=A0A1S4DNW9_TOBAC|nr:PREDICTED: uncharacterized protein LOC107831823 [Nicotiana tabacum]